MRPRCRRSWRDRLRGADPGGLAGLPPARLLVNNASIFRNDSLADFLAAAMGRAPGGESARARLLTQRFAAALGGENG
jgi:hypothetical protein